MEQELDTRCRLIRAILQNDEFTATERLILYPFAECYDEAKGVSIINYERACLSAPFLRRQPQTWRYGVRHLSRRGLIRLVRRGNQNIPSEWELTFFREESGTDIS